MQYLLKLLYNIYSIKFVQSYYTRILREGSNLGYGSSANKVLHKTHWMNEAIQIASRASIIFSHYNLLYVKGYTSVNSAVLWGENSQCSFSVLTDKCTKHIITFCIFLYVCRGNRDGGKGEERWKGIHFACNTLIDLKWEIF